MFKLIALINFWLASKKEIAKNDVLIDYFNTLSFEDEKEDAQLKIKIEGLKKQNEQDEGFIKYLWRF